MITLEVYGSIIGFTWLCYYIPSKIDEITQKRAASAKGNSNVNKNI